MKSGLFFKENQIFGKKQNHSLTNSDTTQRVCLDLELNRKYVEKKSIIIIAISNFI